MENVIAEKAPLLQLTVFMMVGIVVGEYVPINVPLLPVFMGMLALALFLWRYRLWQSLALCGCFMVLGGMLMVRQKTAMKVVWPEKEVRFEAVVQSEPVEKPKTMAVDVVLPLNHRKLKCYLHNDVRSRALKIGDGLLIQSHIRENSDWRIGTFDYRRYLEIHGFSGTTYVPGWKWRKASVSLKNLSRTERASIYFLKLRSRLLHRLSSHGVENDQYAVVAAMTLGDKSALTKELKDTYSLTGASHVLALSGLHLGIIYTLLSWLVVGRRWRVVSQIIVVLGIWAFVFLVGLSTSVVRSAIMLSVYALLALGHRNKMSVNTLSFTAIVMLMVNPLSLFDTGFQMSFMAVFSILLFLPLLEGFFSREFLISHRILKWIWGVAGVSFAAQIGTAPLVAYYFGRFSTCFLLTNFIVLPAAMLIICLVLVVLAVPSLSFLLTNVATGLNSILGSIAAIPGTSISDLHPTGLQVAMCYVIIVCLYLLWRMYSKQNRLHIS